jgi:hypothetical protein
MISYLFLSTFFRLQGMNGESSKYLHVCTICIIYGTFERISIKFSIDIWSVALVHIDVIKILSDIHLKRTFLGSLMAYKIICNLHNRRNKASMLPHSLDNRFTDGGVVVRLTRRPPFTSTTIVRLEAPIEKSSDVTWNRNHDLPACSIVPQPTMVPLALYAH